MTSREQLRGLIDHLCKQPDDETLLAVLADAMAEAEAEDIRYVLTVFISRHRTDLIADSIVFDETISIRQKVHQLRELTTKEGKLSQRICNYYGNRIRKLQNSCPHPAMIISYSHERCSDCDKLIRLIPTPTENLPGPYDGNPGY